VTVDTRQWLDCPTAGPLDVTDEWRFPTRAAGSWVRHAAAAELFGMDWTTYIRRTGQLGYEDRIRPEDNVRALTCPGCAAVVRVWVNGRPLACGTLQHNRRPIETKTGPAARRGKCSAVCLNGKRSCDCRCNGKCHGAGVCRCTA